MIRNTPTLLDAGKDKQANWLMIYGGRATLSLILDVEILAALVNEVAGKDLTLIFQNYLLGRQFPDLDKHLSLAGYEVVHFVDEFYIEEREDASAAQLAVRKRLTSLR